MERKVRGESIDVVRPWASSLPLFQHLPKHSDSRTTFVNFLQKSTRRPISFYLNTQCTVPRRKNSKVKVVSEDESSGRNSSSIPWVFDFKNMPKHSLIGTSIKEDLSTETMDRGTLTLPIDIENESTQTEDDLESFKFEDYLENEIEPSGSRRRSKKFLIQTQDRATSPIVTNISKTNQKQLFEELEHLTGHIIIQKFITRSDEEFHELVKIRLPGFKVGTEFGKTIHSISTIPPTEFHQRESQTDFNQTDSSLIKVDSLDSVEEDTKNKVSIFSQEGLLHKSLKSDPLESNNLKIKDDEKNNEISKTEIFEQVKSVKSFENENQHIRTEKSNNGIELNVLSLLEVPNQVLLLEDKKYVTSTNKPEEEEKRDRNDNNNDSDENNENILNNDKGIKNDIENIIVEEEIILVETPASSINTQVSSTITTSSNFEILIPSNSNPTLDIVGSDKKPKWPVFNNESEIIQILDVLENDIEELTSTNDVNVESLNDQMIEMEKVEEVKVKSFVSETEDEEPSESCSNTSSLIPSINYFGEKDEESSSDESLSLISLIVGKTEVISSTSTTNSTVVDVNGIDSRIVSGGIDEVDLVVVGSEVEVDSRVVGVDEIDSTVVLSVDEVDSTIVLGVDEVDSIIVVGVDEVESTIVGTSRKKCVSTQTDDTTFTRFHLKRRNFLDQNSNQSSANSLSTNETSTSTPRPTTGSENILDLTLHVQKLDLRLRVQERKEKVMKRKSSLRNTTTPTPTPERLNFLQVKGRTMIKKQDNPNSSKM